MKLIQSTIDVTRNTSPNVSDQPTFTKLRYIRTWLSTVKIPLIVDFVESTSMAIPVINLATTTNMILYSPLATRTLVLPILCTTQMAKIALIITPL